ncbi:MAG: hypothetical protein DMG22_16900 [Acidobacteria bacterium]|nr:MAG: hypothetical protein DMG22_16900 [Acidobacteriota bacterium]
MISGNATWAAALALGAKQPLYLFEIPDLGLIIASYSQSEIATPVLNPPPGAQGGYGVTLCGLGGYGT